MPRPRKLEIQETKLKGKLLENLTLIRGGRVSLILHGKNVIGCLFWYVLFNNFDSNF